MLLRYVVHSVRAFMIIQREDNISRTVTSLSPDGGGSRGVWDTLAAHIISIAVT